MEVSIISSICLKTAEAVSIGSPWVVLVIHWLGSGALTRHPTNPQGNEITSVRPVIAEVSNRAPVSWRNLIQSGHRDQQQN